MPQTPQEPDDLFAAPAGRGAGLPSEAQLPDLPNEAHLALGEAHLARRQERQRPQKLAALREAVREGRNSPPPRTGGAKFDAGPTLARLDQQKLIALAASIQKLVPLAREGTKQVVMNQLNPVMAASVAAAESAARLKHLRRWQHLGGRERMVHVTGLMASLADIVGALTPPPVNVAAQALGAGMSLMMIASEGGTTPAPPPTGKLSEWGDNLSHNLLDRWQSFTARVEKKLPPRRPPPD